MNLRTKSEHAIMDSPGVKTMKELQKNRGVILSWLNKANLIELCNAAILLGLEIDPDRLVVGMEGGVLPPPPYRSLPPPPSHLPPPLVFSLLPHISNPPFLSPHPPFLSPPPQSFFLLPPPSFSFLPLLSPSYDLFLKLLLFSWQRIKHIWWFEG